jgi:predicted PurR-regulated permease PerM
LIGGALLGIVGALVAIPIAAALRLLTQEVLIPRLDNARGTLAVIEHSQRLADAPMCVVG